ncbi:hypothetical protein SAMN05444274_104188 [Mariniphaga anaerophila]|uniref:Outer membrane protein beta-barrel domain-containing protein n=1 Tax=Mariniphaga anaerophila TaxID=1484053 RepID=A0A1M5A4W1_9BACT|nr:hypothetical protein [Mariniphaga anaerophila]SHF25349.1 hypothetical protein SAMN05444274_104188 [Mariniphaga anaerophila]
MKRIIFFSIFFLLIIGARAQGFKQAVGIRAGWINPGIEYRYYTSEDHSLRALLAARDGGVQLHALTEFHQYDLFSFSEQLVFFYGAGVHFGFQSWDETVFTETIRFHETRHSLVAGIDGVAGVEYVFYEAPVKLGLEVKPYLDVFGRYGFDVRLLDVALTVKYLF